MFLIPIIINLNDGTDVLKLKRDVKFLLFKKNKIKSLRRVDILGSIPFISLRICLNDLKVWDDMENPASA